eukprot:TRINITY_DN14068_c0_g1_i1.p1 TRINITY_DN14068_c0_g1~~TRINITY_DN14068_c0_g1_i1.p1  ORF type:complete len:1458 (+),score=260.29 TRINITY_DN14068_c0_g1_i1:496-4869(+)
MIVHHSVNESIAFELGETIAGPDVEVQKQDRYNSDDTDADVEVATFIKRGQGFEDDTVGILSGSIIKEVVTAEGTVTSWGLIDVVGTNTEKDCIVLATGDVVTTYTAVGPIVTRLPSMSSVDKIVEMPGMGALLIGPGVSDKTILAHLAHPLSIPKPVHGIWNHSSTVTAVFSPNDNTVAILSGDVVSVMCVVPSAVGFQNRPQLIHKKDPTGNNSELVLGATALCIQYCFDNCLVVLMQSKSVVCIDEDHQSNVLPGAYKSISSDPYRRRLACLNEDGTCVTIFNSPQGILMNINLQGPSHSADLISPSMLLLNKTVRIRIKAELTCSLTAVIVKFLKKSLICDCLGDVIESSSSTGCSEWDAFCKLFLQSDTAPSQDDNDIFIPEDILPCLGGAHQPESNNTIQPQPHDTQCVGDETRKRVIACILHLVCEHMKLSSAWEWGVKKLRSFIKKLSEMLGWGQYVSYYGGVCNTDSGWTPPLVGDPKASEIVSGVAQSNWFSLVAVVPDLSSYRYFENSIPPDQRKPTIKFPTLPSLDDILGHGLAQSIKSLQTALSLQQNENFLAQATVEELQAVGREDLAANNKATATKEGTDKKKIRKMPPLLAPSQLKHTHKKPPRAEATCITDLTLGVDVGSGPPSIGHRLLWGCDSRLAVAQSILCSAVPIQLSSSSSSVDTDPAQVQQELLQASNRVMGLPCGRGMLTLSTMFKLSGASLSIPPLVLCGRGAKDQAYTSLDLSGMQAEYTQWPEFMNGCSAALKLQNVSDMLHSHDKVYVRDWVANAVSPSGQPSASTAGVILGLGLLGHLDYLSGSELYSLMLPRHEATTVALLLGLAVCRRGTCDKRASGVLSLHLPPITPHYSEQDAAPGIQAAALLGIGWLYQGSCHRLMSDMAIGELSRSPSDEHFSNLPSYALCAGFSLGLICLKKGTEEEPGHLADLGIKDRLLALLNPTSRTSGTGRNNNTHNKEDDDPILWNGNRFNHVPSSRVVIGPEIDLMSTAPAAAVALGLMFMESGNAVIYRSLLLPDTAPLLLQVSPDGAMARIIAACLLKWDSVTPSHSWITSMTPPVITKALASSKDPNSDMRCLHEPGTFQHIMLLHSYIIAGCLFALGMRFAGSGRTDARDLILEHLEILVKSQATVGDHCSTITSKTLGPCVNAACIASSMVMSGTGCNKVSKALRQLHRKKDDSYGTQLCLSMSMGLLYLGAGHRTLSNTPHAIAAMLISFYPRFPDNPTDGMYHPQFLRPLYVLATVPRILQTKDILTRESAPVEVRLDGVDACSPCVIPSKFTKIEVIDSSYHYQVTEPSNVSKDGVIWVKKTSKAERLASIERVLSHALDYALFDMNSAKLETIKITLSQLSNPTVCCPELVADSFVPSLVSRGDKILLQYLRPALISVMKGVPLTPPQRASLVWYGVPPSRKVLHGVRDQNDLIKTLPLASHVAIAEIVTLREAG